MTPIKTTFAVLEILNNKAVQAIFCENYDDAVVLFSQIVSEYGVEPYEEMINENIFCEDGTSGSTVQIVPLSGVKLHNALDTLDFAVKKACEAELSDEIAANSHPDVVNDFCDTISYLKQNGICE